jgi:Domain of unknown function (DUF6285)
MHDQPDPDDLLRAVADFLREQAMPQLQGQAAFHARVAANLVELVRRQIAQAPQTDELERAGLQALLRADGNVTELNRLLCARINNGELDLTSPNLIEHLWQVTLAKLAVDQPGYQTYRREVAAAHPPEQTP